METKIITLKDICENPDIADLVNSANRALEVMGYTEHGPRHVGFVSRTAANILKELGYEERTVELAAITGWLHDVGNLINRVNHGITGAALLIPILSGMGMPMSEIVQIAGAIGNHEEQGGKPISSISAALIIADKIDAHRTRVRRGKYDYNDIHDRVNYAIKQNNLFVDKQERIIKYDVHMDESSSLTDFFQIYLSRMRFAEEAAKFLGCAFRFYFNGQLVNTVAPENKSAPGNSAIVSTE